MNPQNTSSESAGEGGFGERRESGGAFAETKTKIAETARETASKVKAAANSTASRVKEETSRMAGQKKEAAAERIGNYSTAIHDSARSLEEKDPNIAWFAHQAADRLQGAADYVRTRDFQSLRADLEGVARRHPAAFFGGLFVVGLILGNVVKASAQGNNAGGELDYTPDEGDETLGSARYVTGGGEESGDLTAAERSAAGI